MLQERTLAEIHSMEDYGDISDSISTDSVATQPEENGADKMEWGTAPSHSPESLIKPATEAQVFYKAQMKVVEKALDKEISSCSW